MFTFKDFHMGRSWNGPGLLERDCPCKKAPCGLVYYEGIDDNCLEHPAKRMKTMRSMHRATECPAVKEGEKSV